LRAAAKMEAEMSTSCSSNDAPAQTSAAVSATAAALSGDGASSSPQRISDSAGREGPWRGFPSPFSAGGPLPPPPPPPPEAAQVTSSRPNRARPGPVGRPRSGRGHRAGIRGGIGVRMCAAMGGESTRRQRRSGD
jgi:hypothetical protein